MKKIAIVLLVSLFPAVAAAVPCKQCKSNGQYMISPPPAPGTALYNYFCVLAGTDVSGLVMADGVTSQSLAAGTFATCTPNVRCTIRSVGSGCEQNKYTMISCGGWGDCNS